jgi:hypothetical protein
MPRDEDGPEIAEVVDKLADATRTTADATRTTADMQVNLVRTLELMESELRYLSRGVALLGLVVAQLAKDASAETNAAVWPSLIEFVREGDRWRERHDMLTRDYRRRE